MKLAVLDVLFLGLMSASSASAWALEPNAVCVGPHVDRVIQGDWQHGIRDKVIGAAPDILTGPGGHPSGRKLTAGTAYNVVERKGAYVRLAGTRFSAPYPLGAAVGWVRAADVGGLALRNCN